MIRQHFYPKTYFRHRSLSKGTCKNDSFLQQNCQARFPKEIQCNQIKFKRKKNKDVLKQIIEQQDQFNNYQSSNTQTLQKIQIKPKISNSKIQSFIHDQIHTQFSSEQQTTVLRQIHNRTIKDTQQNQTQKYKFPQNDLKNLFIKSDRKEIIKNKQKSSYRILGHSNSQNQSFLIDGEWKNYNNKQSTRKLSSADASHRCYRRSIQRKKKQDRTPAQIIINASMSSVEVPPKATIKSERQNQPPVFEKITQNLINLNLSKAIKYRQSSMQQKIRRQRKTSQKISLQNIENRAYDLEQKVRGWQILVEDDVDFS